MISHKRKANGRDGRDRRDRREDKRYPLYFINYLKTIIN